MSWFRRRVGGSSTRRKLVLNATSLYAVQGCTFLLPLITFPYLGRTLGPSGWGAVLFAQAIGAMLAMIVEYGFDFSATREAAQHAGDPKRLRELVTGVVSAKVVLALIGVVGALIARPFTTKIAASPVLFWASVFWGIGQGINMLWYFQGLQRMGWAGGLDIAGKLVATASIFLLVHRPEDGWKVMAAQAIGCSVSHALTLVQVYREVGFSKPSMDLVMTTLRRGWPMFLFRASMTFVTSVSGLVLGFMSSPTQVGLFGSAEKFRLVGNQMLWPISQTLFPHQAQTVRENPARGVDMVRRSMLALGTVAAVFGLIVIVAAPQLVHLILGPQFEEAVPILRVFGLIIPIQAMCTVVSAQWMLPLGLDKQISKVVVSSGVVNLAAGILFTLKAGAFGMSLAVGVTQVYMLLALEVALRSERFSLFSGRHSVLKLSRTMS